jgi:hypothetical protein
VKVSENVLFKIMARCAIDAEMKGSAKNFPKYIVTPSVQSCSSYFNTAFLSP